MVLYVIRAEKTRNIPSQTINIQLRSYRIIDYPNFWKTGFVFFILSKVIFCR